MRDQDFQLFAELLKAQSGLSVGPDKKYLLETRLTPIALKFGFDDFDRMADEVRFKRPQNLINAVVEAMTTNESFFFRDGTPFDVLKNQVLPKLHDARKATKSLRIWCGAASTGQEPYSIAMMIKEQQPKWDGWTIEILGTDISNEALEKAKAGTYSQFEVQRGLPVHLMLKYFTQDGDRWTIDPSIRSMVRYRPFNLMHGFSGLGTFDIVFLRNVLIYFDAATKTSVFEKIRGTMAKDGALFLGAAETVIGISEQFRSVRGLRGLFVPTEYAHEASLRYAAAS